jgi:hypothetical protein
MILRHWFPILFATFALGCSNAPESGVALEERGGGTSVPDPGTLRVVSVAPVPYPGGNADPFAFEFLGDPMFRELPSDRMPRPVSAPLHTWYVQVPGLPAKACQKHKKPEDSPAGVDMPYVVELGKSSTRTTLGQQTARIGSTVRQAFVHGKAWGKAAGANQLALVVRHSQTEDAPGHVVAIHPGDGKWHELLALKHLEGPFTNLTFTFEMVKGTGDEAVYVGPVSLRLAQEPPGAAGSNLLENPGFDDHAFLDPSDMSPWAVSVWGGNQNRMVKLIDATEEPGRRYLLELPPLTEGALGVYQRVTPEKSAQGKRLVARVWAKAGDPDALHFQIATRQEGDSIRNRRVHRGDGKWEELVVDLTLPPDASPPEVEVDIIRYAGKGSGPAWVDAVSLEIE